MSDRKDNGTVPGAEPKDDKYQLEGGGESGGGAYPNPHSGKEGKSSFGGFMGHGGQSDMNYHGTGQLGEQSTGQGNVNSPARKASDEPDVGKD